MKDAAESRPSDRAMIMAERTARLEAEAVAARAQAVNSNTEALI
jgi:transposase